jgi:prepilin signal peptidase PulO-like enzyme (type II secretory pathway)
MVSAVALLTLLALRRLSLQEQVPFGPFMVVGAAAALLL